MTDIDPGAPAPDASFDAESLGETLDSGSETVESGLPGSETVESAPDVPEAPAVEEPSDPFSEFGGRDVVAAAHRLYEASRTEDGVIQLFLEAGRNLGLGLDQMQALFEELGGSGQVPEDDPSLDEPLTRRELLELEQQRQAAEQQRQAQQLQEFARTAVTEALSGLGVDPQTNPATHLILQFADRHRAPDAPMTAESIKEAVRAGYADYQAHIEREAQAYLTKKRQAAAAVPKAPAGSGAPAAPAPAEPKNVAEAIKQVRQKLGLSG